MKRSFFVFLLLMAVWVLLPQASRAQDLVVTTTNISGYTYSGGVLTIQDAGDYTIAMASGVATTTDHIVIAGLQGSSDEVVNITLSGVNINTSAIDNTAAFYVTPISQFTTIKRTTNITLADGTNNVLTSGINCAGLQQGVYTISTYKLYPPITIQGNGSLTATGGQFGAGIGGGSGCGCDGITMGGGIVTAIGGKYGAGIGGGYGGESGWLAFTNGTIFATGGAAASGIGGGQGGGSGTISISGGSIKATSGSTSVSGMGSTPTCTISGISYTLTCYAYTFPYQYRRVVTNMPNLGTWSGKDNIMTDEKGIINLWLPTSCNNSVYASRCYSSTKLPTMTAVTCGGYTFSGCGTMVPQSTNREELQISTNIADGYSYNDNIWNITKAGHYTLSMASGLNATYSNKIDVSATGSDTVFITLNGVKIDVSQTSDAAAFNINSATTAPVKVILAGGTENILASGANCAGLQKSNNASNFLTIAGGGSLTATGGQYGAGIGGGYGTAASNIIITDGSIKATAGSGAQSIGGGAGAATSSPTNGTANGSAALTCYTYNFTDHASCVVTNFTGLPSYYGSNGITTDVNGKIYLWLPDATLPVITADCEGENYTSYITESDGSVTMKLTSTIAYDISVTSSVSAGYIYNGGIINITKKGNYSLRMEPGTTSTTNRVIVSGSAATAGDTICITLAGINIDASATSKVAAFDITGTVNVKVILAENTENTLKSGAYCAGLQKSNDAAYNLAIGGDGSLAATAGMGGAGIGSKMQSSCSNITITGGTVVATGGSAAAGIGGGLRGAATNITITGGSVNAIPGKYNSYTPQAIGNGYNSGATNYTPTNGSAALTLYTYTFTGLAGTDITHYAGLPTYFGTKGIKTDASGNIYLYLPSGYSLTPKVEESYTLSNGYSTLCYPTAVALEGNAKAYTITGTDANDYIVYTEVTGTLPAHTPVLLCGPAESSLTLPTVLYDATQTGLANSLLKGTYTALSAPVGSYVLQKQDGVIAFYKVATGKQPSVGAFRCYLESGSNGINVLRIGDGTLDGIETPVNDNETLGDFTIYDLAGRKVMEPQKGKVYIVNGKKAIFK